MFDVIIHFFCLSPLGLIIKLNFNISKVAYWDESSARKERGLFTI